MQKEEDFKKILKKLLLEKQKQEFIETEPKLESFDEASQAVAFKDHLRAKIQDNQKNEAHSNDIITDLKTKLEKVRPTLKKLMDEVKRSQDYIRQMEEEKKELEEEAISLKKAHLKDLEQHQREKEGAYQELNRLKEQLKSAKDEGAFSKNIHYEEEIRSLKKEIENLHLAQVERQKEWEESKNQDIRHLQQLENERQRLVEKLAENLSQTQRQADYIKETRDEISQYKQKIHQYQAELTIRDKESEDLRQQANKSQFELEELKDLFNKKEAENLTLKEKIIEVETKEKGVALGLESQDELKQKIEQQESLLEVLKSELAQVHIEKKDLETAREESLITEKKASEFWNVKLNELIQEHEGVLVEKEKKFESALQLHLEAKNKLEKEIDELSQKYEITRSQQEKDKEEIENLSEVVNNFRHQYQERESELRKAQQHLAKKIKETTLLRDLVERQKVQLIDFQNTLTQSKSELSRLQNQFNLQRQHEEKLHLIAKERALSAEEQSKSWQEKFLELQSHHVALKHESNELIKIKKSYDFIMNSINEFKHSLESIPLSSSKLEISEQLNLQNLTPQALNEHQ